MSWSFSIKATPVEGFGAAADAALADAMKNIEMNNPDGKDQAIAVVEAIKQLVASGALGSSTVSAILSGHGNPGHRPQAGWSNDSVYISLGCADRVEK